MALEDSEQKLNLLHSIFTDLEDLSAIFNTDELTQSIQQLSGQVTALQQKLMESLPQIQRMADVSVRKRGGFLCFLYFIWQIGVNCYHILVK